MNFKDKIKDLKPYDLNCNVFDVYSYNGLSMQELLCQFFHKINECIKISNETIDLASWLVNEGLSMEVANKLMLWLGDGTLENIINVNLFNSLYTKIGNLNSQLEHIVKINICNYTGANDDEIFENMLNDITNNYKNTACKIVVGGRDYNISKPLIFENLQYKIFDFQTNIITNYCDAIIIKNCSKNTFNFNRITGDTSINTNLLDSHRFNGITIINSELNKISLNDVFGFKEGIRIEGVNLNDGGSSGSFGQVIDFKRISRCFEAIKIIDDNNGGWVNENIIRGGGIWAKYGVVSGHSSYDYSGTSRYHNNKFYDIEFEQIYGGCAITLYNAHSNLFAYPRFEGGGNPIQQLIINESDYCRNNEFITSRYTLHLEQIKLGTGDKSCSKLYGDIRYNTNPIARQIEVIPNVGLTFTMNYGELPSYITSSLQNNSIINHYDTDYLFSVKKNDEITQLCWYECPIYVKNDEFKNNFTNFTTNEGSTTKLRYYKTGNEVVVEGIIKGGTSGSEILTLPSGYRPDKQIRIPVSVWHNLDGNIFGTIEITTGGKVIFLSDVTQVNRIFLDGIRFKYVK